jgi:hypothetical protein
MSYAIEWVAAGFAAAFVVFLCAPSFVLIATMAVVLAAAAAVVALAAAVVAAPYLLGSYLHRRWLAWSAASRRRGTRPATARLSRIAPWHHA